MEFSTTVLTQYAITAAKAVTIAIVGWVFAVIGQKVVERITGSVEILRKQESLPKSAGKLAYYFIILIATVAVLEVVGFKYVTQPFIDLLNKVADYFPNLIGAVLILVIGTFFAKVAREFVDSLLKTFQVEEFGKRYGIEDLSGAIANTVYLLVFLFVIVAALNALQIKAITEPAVAMLTLILAAIPRIAAASIVFGIIFYVGKVVAGITAKIVDELNVDKLAREVGISSEKLKFEDLVRYLILTFAVLIGFGQAFHYLEAEALYRLTYQFTVIAFKLIVGAAIVFAGVYLGNLFEKRTENKTIGKGTKFAFIIASILIALPYIGISPQTIEIVVLSVSLGVGLAFALAFGLGGKEIAADLLRKFLKTEQEK